MGFSFSLWIVEETHLQTFHLFLNFLSLWSRNVRYIYIYLNFWRRTELGWVKKAKLSEQAYIFFLNRKKITHLITLTKYMGPAQRKMALKRRLKPPKNWPVGANANSIPPNTFFWSTWGHTLNQRSNSTVNNSAHKSITIQYSYRDWLWM